VKGRKKRQTLKYISLFIFLVNGIKRIYFVVGMMLIYPKKALKKLPKLAKLVNFFHSRKKNDELLFLVA